MSKEINIDEILTRSKKQAEDKKTKASKIIDSETGEETTTTQSSRAHTNQTGGFGGPAGMPGNFSDIFSNPEVTKMFSEGAIPGVKSLPLKQRIMFKLMGFFSKTGRRNLLRKRWWPLWAILLIVIVAVSIVAVVFIVIYKLLKAIIMPYVNIFRKTKA